MDQTELPAATPRAPRWPWLCLIAAVIWVAIVRVPLVLNAEIHLDSDLAVDGLTLLEATHGRLRWHFPGTPYMGIGPVLLSLPAALLFGVNASTLVAGGVIAYELFVVATFVLMRRAFGPVAAVGALVPLAFASVGTVWLSGRLTGGHLLTLAWHAGALAMVPTFREKGGYLRAFLFGVWCGVGYYLDSMFLATLPFVGVLAAASVLGTPGVARRVALFLLLAVGFVVGELPREVGSRIDPHDAYKDQLATIFERDAADHLDRERVKGLLLAHLELFSRECLPRLITGHRLVAIDLPTEPRPQALAGGDAKAAPRGSAILASSLVALVGNLFAASTVALAWVAAMSRPARTPTANGDRSEVDLRTGVAFSMLGSAALVSALFLVNKNIYNSDNYRYLVYFLLPWCAGYGLIAAWLWGRGTGGKVAAGLLSMLLAVLFTLDTASWYRGFGWVDGEMRPMRRPVLDPTLDYLRDHPEIDSIFGGYWDVYRYKFLLNGRIGALPFPDYPDRYNDADRFPGHQPRVLVARQGDLDFYRMTALAEDGKVLFRGRDRLVIDWPRGR